MSRIRLEKLRRLTLPADIIAQAGWRPDDVLDASYANGAIILRPASAPAAVSDPLSMLGYAGASQGAWGETAAEVEWHVAQDRASWDR
ncbi:AbrB/MazE/SpoVT family DNA-binding domain-containing protein [Duganella sp. Leaf126]|uniref:AbrB/MazE/SpoVT family DNA-binding domain-containing protein n=1 Tax=Duganella sp. Leaf126 TaxID=1736266 RepID=UPI0012E1282D|nr:AbrB/MazE/SpoVT family DNA-binding domain-containing protein [Duganella sp. Leaf126]